MYKFENEQKVLEAVKNLDAGTAIEHYIEDDKSVSSHKMKRKVMKDGGFCVLANEIYSVPEYGLSEKETINALNRLVSKKKCYLTNDSWWVFPLKYKQSVL